VNLLDESKVIDRVTSEARRHVLSEFLEVAKLCAHLQAWDVVDDVEEGEGRACEVRDLFSVPDLFRALGFQLGLIGGLVAEKKDQSMNGLREHGQVIVFEAPHFVDFDTADAHVFEHDVEEGGLRLHLDPARPGETVGWGEGIVAFGGSGLFACGLAFSGLGWHFGVN